MTATRRCPRCRAELSPDRPDGLCPACLMGAVASPELGPEDESLAGADLARADTVEAEPLPNSDPLPRIPRYRLLEPVGEGGMGVVYKAEQLAPMRRTVAVKLIKLGMDTRQVVARFESERQALALLSHPNVAAVYDGGATDTGRPYFVMEWVPGEPITEFCDRHNYTTKQRLELFIQACDAIQHAHQKAIIHRDIKPTNLLVTLDGDKPLLKVIDFGVAKAMAHRLTEQTMFTEQGQLIGTPEYMSPEQAEMNALDVDTRTDVYSLGVVLYELLTGAVPFDYETLRRAAYAQIQRIIREVDPPRPSTRLSSLGDSAIEVAKHRQMELAALERQLRNELEWIPLKAIRKDRSQRYGSAAALAEDVQNYLEHRALHAGPESASYRLRKFVRRNKGPVAAGISLVLVLAAGVAVASWQAIRIRAEQRQTLLQKQEAERQREEAQRQELEAKNQAAIANAVSQFQSDMLASADPNNLLGDRVTVIEATQAAVKELDAGKLMNQPLVEAGIRMTIGNTLRKLGRYDDALPNLQWALEVRQKILHAGHPDIARSMIDLASLLHDQGKRSEAEVLYRGALKIAREAFPAGHPHIAVSLDNLAGLLQDQGKLSEAEPLSREALEISRRTLPAGHPEIAASLSNRAALLREHGKLSEAEALCREALELRRKALPAGHPQISMSLSQLGLLLSDQGKLSEAELLSREVVELRRTALPADHPDIANALSNLASLLFMQGKAREAEPLSREALEIARKALPTTHPDLTKILNFLGLILREQGRLSEAEPLLREALEIARNGLPAGHPDIAIGLNSLALLLQTQGRLSEAEPLFRESLEIMRKAFPSGHSTVATALLNLASALHREGKLTEAEPLLREALDHYRRALPEGHPEVANPLNHLALLLKAQGKLSEAEAVCREGLEIRRKTLPTGHPAILNSLHTLSGLRLARGDLAEAESLLLEARQMLLTSGRGSHQAYTSIFEGLATLYDTTGRPESAANTRAELAAIVPSTRPTPTTAVPVTATTTAPTTDPTNPKKQEP